MTYFTWINGDFKQSTTAPRGVKMGLAARLKRYEQANRDWLYKVAVWSAVLSSLLIMYAYLRSVGVV